MCIVGVISGGHYDQGRDSLCKASLILHIVFHSKVSYCLLFFDISVVHIKIMTILK